MQATLGKNHFDLFGLPVSFDVNLADLNARYRDLQRQFHPDRFAAASDQERRLAMQMTAAINEAARVLRDPVLRGRYMLQLAGVNLGDEADTHMDANFLMEQMELREALEAIPSKADPAGALLVFVSDLSAAQQLRLGRLQDLLRSPTKADYQLARTILREMQFLQKLSDEAGRLEETLLD